MPAIFIFSHFDITSILYTRQRANMFLEELENAIPFTFSQSKAPTAVQI